MSNKTRLNNSFNYWQANVFAAWIAILLSTLMLVPCGITRIALARGQESPSGMQDGKDARLLEVSKPIERELAGGQVQNYKVTIEAGQYLHLIVEQRGIDVVVALYGPDDKKLIEGDSPNGAYGPEPISVIVDASGSYRLEVRSLEKEAPAGRYEVKITDLRTATAQDHSRVLAERAFADGYMLESQGTAESLRKAIDIYEEALKKFHSAGDRLREGDSINQIGSIHARLGENQKALDYFNRALSLWRAVGDRGGEATNLNDIGLVYNSLGEKQKALDYLNQALPLWRAVGNRNGEASTLNNIGLVYNSLGEKQKALDHYNQALPLWRAAGDRSGEASTLNNLGDIYNSLGENQKALDYFNQVFPLRLAVGDRRGEAVTLNNIGSVYDSLGEEQKALDNYNKALPLWQVVGDRNGEASTLNNIGLVYDSLGEKQKALDYLNQALPLSRAVGDRSGEAAALNNIGSVYAFLGEKQKAIDNFNRALPLWRAVGDRRGEAETLNGIGFVYNALSEEQKALDYFNQALPLRRAVDDRRGEATTLNNIGFAYYSLGEKQKALDYFNQALPLSLAAGDRRVEAGTLSNLGGVYNSLGEKQKALDYYSQALPLRRAVGDRRGEATTLLGIARVESALGKLLDARSTIESARSIVESLRTNVISPESRSSFFATTQDFYEFSIDLLMQLHKIQPDRGYDREALQTAERARARSLLDELVEARLQIRSGADPALLERERALGQLLSAKTERQIRLLNGKHTEQQATEYANEIEALTAQYQDVEAEIRAKSPRYAALTQPQPLKPEEIQQQVLDDQTLLLEYFLGKERSYLWVISTNAIKCYELPKRQGIEEQALRVKKLLTARATDIKGESSERRQARITEADARYWREAERLSGMILEPALSDMDGKRLAIVPDGELQEVAFGALPVPRVVGGGGNKSTARKESGLLPMMVEHEIVSLPSASALAVLRKETAGREPAPNSVAVLADPVFDKDDGRIQLAHAARKGKVDGVETEVPVNRDLNRATRDVMGEETHFSRLPFSKREAEAILSVTPKASSLEALDFDASRATAMSDELNKYRIVHFATHGFVDKLHPELSGIVLSLVNREGRPQNGFLQLHDVYNLNLPAELVVLSACQTGLGKSVRGEGLVGLTRGFMYAGAKRVVASLWSVQDLATAELMKRFYGAMLGERGMSPAAALHEAQMEMWKQRQWRSPFYWGGFMLYGEW